MAAYQEFNHGPKQPLSAGRFDSLPSQGILVVLRQHGEVTEDKPERVRMTPLKFEKGLKPEGGVRRLKVGVDQELDRGVCRPERPVIGMRAGQG